MIIPYHNSEIYEHSNKLLVNISTLQGKSLFAATPKLVIGLEVDIRRL